MLVDKKLKLIRRKKQRAFMILGWAARIRARVKAHISGNRDMNSYNAPPVPASEIREKREGSGENSWVEAAQF